MKPDISSEIQFQTARSGGSGGQNVNKVETMVEGRWKPADSKLFTAGEKLKLLEKLESRLTKEGVLRVKSQEARTQPGNKDLVIRKMNDLVYRALIRKKARIATKPTRSSNEKRIEGKTQRSNLKQYRRRVKPDDY